jgi:hypothetical protein
MQRDILVLVYVFLLVVKSSLFQAPCVHAVQKLDYLQLLLVEAVSEAVGNTWDGIVATCKRVVQAGADAGAAAAEETGMQYVAPFLAIFCSC